MQVQHEINWESIRGEYPILDEVTYLNTPASGLMHSSIIEAGQRVSTEYFNRATEYKEEWIFKNKDLVVAEVASFMGCEKEELALSPNFSLALNMAADILRTHKKVGLLQGDYPSLTLPWKLKGYEVVEFAVTNRLTIDYDLVETTIKRERIEVLAISHVQWSSGLVVDLSRLSDICRRNDVLFVVDATQSSGVLPVDINAQHIDILVASTYKWLGAGFGNGFMYVKKGLLDRYIPKIAGFNSFLWDQGKPYYRSTIKSFEPGHLDHEAFTRLKAAMERHRSIGKENIYLRVKSLMDYFLEQAKHKGVEVLGDFTPAETSSFAFVNGDAQLCKLLAEQRVITSPRGPGIRMGVHYYNDKTDIDRFLEVYTSLSKS